MKKFITIKRLAVTILFTTALAQISMAQENIGVCSGSQMITLGGLYPNKTVISSFLDAPITDIRYPEFGDPIPETYTLYFEEDRIVWAEKQVFSITLKTRKFKAPNFTGVRVGDNISTLSRLRGTLTDESLDMGEYAGFKSWRPENDASDGYIIWFYYDNDNIIKEIHLSLLF